MITLVNRSLSLLVLVGYIVAARHLGALDLLLKIGLPLLLAIACIWFPDEFGDLTGIVHYHLITTSTPGFAVCAVGWLILLGLPLVIWYIANGTSTA